MSDVIIFVNEKAKKYYTDNVNIYDGRFTDPNDMDIKDFLFPKFCLGCGFIGTYICPQCQKHLKYIDKDQCIYCERPSACGFTHPWCKKTYGLDGYLSLFKYNPMFKRIIKSIKYRLVTDIWHELCLIFKPRILEKISFYKRISGNMVLQPIPLHKNKMKLRGFNQADLISRFVSSATNMPTVFLLERLKETSMQAQLHTRNSRYGNIRGAFDAIKNSEVTNKQIILIDDVITTGFTLKEASSVLKKAGAEKVFALTIARG